MLKWICAVALAASGASPALAQKPKDRPPNMIVPPDIEVVMEGNREIKQAGECNVTFVIGEDGKTKDLSAQCTVAEYGPYAIRAMQASVWEPEIMDGEPITSLPKRQAFKFAAVSGAADPRGEKAPVQVTGIEPKEVSRVINQVDKPGTCNVKFTVGVDGKPKDIEPNCSESAFNDGIAAAVSKMVYQPGLKGGQPTDWPGMSIPMTLTKPNG